MTRKDLLYRFYVQKEYDKLKYELEKSENPDEIEILGKIYVIEGSFDKAAVLYQKFKFDYEFGRCLLLQGKLEQAKEVFKNIKDINPTVLWARSLIQMIERYVIDVPTFFQIRSFLEVDLDALMKAKQYEFCENIINCADVIAQSNSESYKFIARVFVNHNLHDIAKIYLEKAKDICYIDPEVHFLLAKCYLANNNKIRAKESLKTCIDKACGYYPAKKLLEQLNFG